MQGAATRAERPTTQGDAPKAGGRKPGGDYGREKEASGAEERRNAETRTMGQVSRPSALTAELREQVERELADDVPVVVVAQNAGVSPRTVHSWLKAGRVERRRTPEPLDVDLASAPEDEPTLDEKLIAAEPGLAAVILAAAQRGSWQAALAILERRLPERWSRPTRGRPIEQPPEPTPESGSVWSAIDELAARRRGARMSR
jgi:hypothetical protein